MCIRTCKQNAEILSQRKDAVVLKKYNRLSCNLIRSLTLLRGIEHDGLGAVREEEFADFRRPFVHVAGNIDERNLKEITVSQLDSGIVSVLNQKIDELKEQYKDKYKKRLDITKARKLTVDFILQGEKELVETKAFTVVWVENRWLVFGDVVEEFEFEKK